MLFGMKTHTKRKKVKSSVKSGSLQPKGDLYFYLQDFMFDDMALLWDITILSYTYVQRQRSAEQQQEPQHKTKQASKKDTALIMSDIA